MRSLARFCYEKRRLVVPGWIGIIVGLFVLSTAFGGEFNTEFSLPGSESQEAIDLLEESGADTRAGFQGQVVFEAEQGVDDPEVRQAIGSFLADIDASIEGLEIESPYTEGNEYLVADGGDIAYAELNFSSKDTDGGDRDFEEYIDAGDVIKNLREEVSVEGLRIELGGDVFAEEPAFSSEAIGLAAAVIILLIAFGSIIAMGLPIFTALFGIGCGVAIIGLLTRIMAVPEFTTQIAAMIGIGVGIDYALLIVSRYRDALRDGLEPEESVVLSIDTSGRAVLFAGLTVVIALLGMFMMNLDFVRAISISAILAVLMTMSASLTLLPALLGFVGRNIDRFGLPHRKEQPGEIHRTIWWRWSRVIQAHPWPALIISTGLLIVIALPIFSLRLGFGDAGNRPDGDTSRQAYDLLSEGFGPGFNSPILVVVDGDNGPPTEGEIQTLVSELEGTEGVASVSGPFGAGDSDLALLSVFPTTAPQDAETTDLVHRLRDQTDALVKSQGSYNILATGGPAGVVDFADYVGERLPFFIGAVLALSFLLLLVVFHSVVVPIKAVLMNLLSIGAAFGAMVAVFQWGWFDFLIGQGKEGPIEAWAPMMLFAIVFGLSMDYEVFLLTRVREEYDRTGDNARAVADGLAATGRVISAAAAIMVCVFGAFVLGEQRDIKLFGFGLAFAVFIDATIVRLVLVPSAMELMGTANWWAPEWLVRYLPTIRVDNVEPAPEPVAGGGG
ncbi:MAG TPA: MMPL family transporter [Dehalococcoidia bacterium]|nr:MMPL family transporter [Dehalococcoidia bacterium]